MSFAKDSVEREMFGEFYRLCEKYWKPTKEQAKDQQFWDQMIMDVKIFIDTYHEIGDDTLIRLTAVIVTRAEDIARGNVPICATSRAVQLIEAMLKAVS